MQREIIDNNLLLCHNMTCIWRKNDMEEYIMKSRFMRIMAIIMAISLLVCSFASCQIAIEEEPADGQVDIAGPDDLGSEDLTEDINGGNSGNDTTINNGGNSTPIINSGNGNNNNSNDNIILPKG